MPRDSKVYKVAFIITNVISDDYLTSEICTVVM